MKHKFSETEDVARKNKDKGTKSKYYDKSLMPYIRERGFLSVRKNVKKVYYSCIDCGEGLKSKALMITGRCMTCERG